MPVSLCPARSRRSCGKEKGGQGEKLGGKKRAIPPQGHILGPTTILP